MSRVDAFIQNPRKALFVLALPMVIAMVVQTMYNVVDTAWVGRLGEEAIAALTFSFPLFFILMSLNSGMGVGMGSLISRSLGAKKHPEAENAALHGVLMSVGLGLLVLIFGTIFLGDLMRLFGAEGNVLRMSISYMSILLLGCLVMFPLYVMNSIFSAEGDTKTPMIIQVTALMANIILDPIFIYSLKLGVAGAAYATVISLALGLVLSIIFMHRRSTIRLRFREFKFSWRIIREISSIGMPAALTMILISMYVVFINGFMNHFGTTFVAAFGIVSRLESVALLPVIALGLSLMTLVAMFTGAKRIDLVKGIVSYGMVIGMLFTSVIGIVFFLFAPWLIRIFTPEQHLISAAVGYLRIDVLTFPLMHLTMTVFRVMQGLGRGMPGLIIQLIRFFGVAVPLAYLFVFVLGFGYLSIAVAMVLGGLVSSVVGIWWLSATIRAKSIKNSDG
ncbi:MAG: MATE family efflux transporter [Nanoarchaeota archaeon]